MLNVWVRECGSRCACVDGYLCVGAGAGAGAGASVCMCVDRCVCVRVGVGGWGESVFVQMWLHVCSKAYCVDYTFPVCLL